MTQKESPDSIHTAADEAHGSPGSIAGRIRGTLTALVPTGWSARETLEIASDDSRVSITTTAEPRIEDTTLEQFSDGHGAALSELPEYNQIDVVSAISLLGGHPAQVRTYEWTPAGGETVRQIAGYVVAENMTYVITATAPASDFDEIDEHLRFLLESFDLANQIATVMNDASPAEAIQNFEWGNTPLTGQDADDVAAPEIIDADLDWAPPRSSWESTVKGVTSDG